MFAQILFAYRENDDSHAQLTIIHCSFFYHCNLSYKFVLYRNTFTFLSLHLKVDQNIDLTKHDNNKERNFGSGEDQLFKYGRSRIHSI